MHGNLMSVINSRSGVFCNLSLSSKGFSNSTCVSCTCKSAFNKVIHEKKKLKKKQQENPLEHTKTSAHIAFTWYQYKFSYCRSFSYRGATLWNSLPCNLRQEESLNRLKQSLNFHFSSLS